MARLHVACRAISLAAAYSAKYSSWQDTELHCGGDRQLYAWCTTGCISLLRPFSNTALVQEAASYSIPLVLCRFAPMQLSNKPQPTITSTLNQLLIILDLALINMQNKSASSATCIVWLRSVIDLHSKTLSYIHQCCYRGKHVAKVQLCLQPWQCLYCCG